MRIRYDSWLEGLNADWLVEPAALLRRAVPGLVPGRRRRRTPSTTSLCCRRRTTLPVDPSTDARPVSARPSATSPVGSPPIPTSWTRGPRRRSRRRSSRGWVDDPDLFGRTFPMDLRPQGPEIIRTWLFDTVVRARLRTRRAPVDRHHDQRLGARPRPQEDVEVEGQRRHARCRSSRSTAPTRCGTGRATAGPASTPRSTSVMMKVGRKLATKVLNASKFVLGVSGDAAEDVAEVVDRARPFAARRARRARRRRHRSVRRVRLRPFARTYRTILLVVLRRLRRAREEPRVRRRGRRRPCARPR